MKYRYKKSLPLYFPPVFHSLNNVARFNWLIKISIRILRIVNYYATMVGDQVNDLQQFGNGRRDFSLWKVMVLIESLKISMKYLYKLYSLRKKYFGMICSLRLNVIYSTWTVVQLKE